MKIQKTLYKNRWYEQGVRGSQEYLETDSEPVVYKDHLIYERMDFGYSVFDIVFQGVCIGMYNGINGAKKRIDEKEKEES